MTSKFKKACMALAVGAGLVLGAAGGADAIVNGTESASGARPYQVSLQTGGEHYCGGSILDATTVVTAAHCVEGESAATTTIRAGVTDATSTAGQDVRVASIVPHPDYARNGLADIAVIKLAEPLTLGGNVQAIPLATTTQLDGAVTGIVSGWGAVSENGESSNVLLEADVPLVSDSACVASLGADARTETCAGGTGTDTCYGDSGGPLAIQTGNGLALAGVTSWGEECGGDTPGAYADVPGLTDWIKAASNGEVAPNPDQGPVDGDDDEFDEEGFGDAEYDDMYDADADSGDAEYDDVYGDDADFGDAEYDDVYGDDADFGDAEYDDVYGEFDEADFVDAEYDEMYGDDADSGDAEYDDMYGDDADFGDAEYDDMYDADLDGGEYDDDGAWFDVQDLETGEVLSLFVDEDGQVWLYAEE